MLPTTTPVPCQLALFQDDSDDDGDIDGIVVGEEELVRNVERKWPFRGEVLGATAWRRWLVMRGSAVVPQKWSMKLELPTPSEKEQFHCRW
mmetsp:Transcript_10051/g.26858  ORF Transcript_10051/g.26858 Transcript_10051/m.26858 type:complete len:91 (-) Transcript_10051:1012-1284(-)